MLLKDVPSKGEAAVHCVTCMYACTILIEDQALGEDSPITVTHPMAMMLDGRWPEHEPSLAVITDYSVIRPVCDFCGRPNPRWLYTYRAITSVSEHANGRIITESDSDWTACAGCSVLVDEGKFGEILRNVLALFPDSDPELMSNEIGPMFLMLKMQGQVPKRLMPVVP